MKFYASGPGIHMHRILKRRSPNLNYFYTQIEEIKYLQTDFPTPADGLYSKI